MAEGAGWSSWGSGGSRSGGRGAVWFGGYRWSGRGGGHGRLRGGGVVAGAESKMSTMGRGFAGGVGVAIRARGRKREGREERGGEPL